ncbi:MAG: ribose 5-phosphate isomerase B [Bacteroidia bacterium]|nr:ribose 5-phosphate isomerase B [Bacteroidia bacterium]
MKDLDTLSVAVACDHAGYELKEEIKQYFAEKLFELKDFGTFSTDSVDYPDMIHPMAAEINAGKFDFGIAICGTGNGVSMVANKYRNIRAALCWKNEIALLARKHNDANIISLPARFISLAEAEIMIESFLTTDFEGGRHSARVNKISNVTNL